MEQSWGCAASLRCCARCGVAAAAAAANGTQSKLAPLIPSSSSTCRWLRDYHLLDALIEQPWRRAPEGWLEALSALTADELVGALLEPSAAEEPAEPRPLPETLRRWLRRVRELSLPRGPRVLAAAGDGDDGGGCATPAWLAAGARAAAASAAEAASGGRRRQQRGVGAKKQHELAPLAELVAAVAAATGADLVVDVGAGKGHLANALADGWGLDVLALEGEARLSGAATATAAAAEAEEQQPQQPASQGKQQPASAGAGSSGSGRRRGRVVSIAARLEAATAAAQIAAAVADARAALDGFAPSPSAAPALRPPRVVLLGLHACGDLTPLLLSAFAGWESAVACVSVGCCYNLLTEGPAPGSGCNGSGEPSSECGSCSGSGSGGGGDADGEAAWRGWPMSRHLREGRGSGGGAAAAPRLGRHARLLACQSAESSLAGVTPAALAATLRQHAMRAALQLLLCRAYPEVDTTGGVSVGRERKRKSKRAGAAGGGSGSGLQQRLEQQQQEEEKQQEEKQDGQQIGAGEGGTAAAEAAPLSAAAAPTDADLDAYAARCLEALRLAPRLQPPALRALWAEARPGLALLPALWWLRLAVAPVIEAAIVRDRQLFLLEATAAAQQEEEKERQDSGSGGGDGGSGGGSGDGVLLLPLFDPRASPRNAALVALKPCFQNQKAAVNKAVC